MSTRHALLNALLRGDASGYDFVKRFQPSAAHWWHPKPAQMYTELPRMEADGLVSAETVIQTKYPNKRVFSLTDAGRDELRRYAERAIPTGEFKDELVIKMLGIDVADTAGPPRRPRTAPQVVRRTAAQRPGKHRNDARGQDADTLRQDADDVGEYLWRLRSIGLMQETIEWCDAVSPASSSSGVPAGQSSAPPERGSSRSVSGNTTPRVVFPDTDGS